MKKILVLVSFFNVSICFAQKNPAEKASLITQTNDTLIGTVFWDSELELSESVLFSENGGSQRRISPNDIKSLQLLGDSTLFEPALFTKKEDGQTIQLKKLAKVICKGKLSLYKMELRGNYYSSRDELPYVFIVRKDGQDYTLFHARSRSGYRFNKYLGILKYLTSDQKVLSESIKSYPYTEESLSAFIYLYNKQSNQPVTSFYQTKTNTSFIHQVKLGGLYAPTYWYADDVKTKGGIGWSISYALDIISPARSKRIYTTIEFGYAMIKMPSTTYKDIYGQQQTINRTIKGLRFSALGTYKLSHTTVTPLLHAGFSMEYTNAISWLPFATAGVGMKTGKFVAGLRYELPLMFDKAIQGIPGLIDLKVGYAFLSKTNKKK